MKRYNVNFINQNMTLAVNEGANLAKICDKAGFSLDLVCGGKGTCGKCMVEIEIKNEKSSVLACMTEINSDLNIYLDEKNYGRNARILESSADHVYSFNPSLKKMYKDKKSIKAEFKDEFLRGCSLDVMRDFAELINKTECKGITFILYEGEIIDVQLGDTTKFIYGAAVDVGTTTVVLYVYDLNTGSLINSYSDLNGQVSAGADVISRISYADSQKSLKELNGKIISVLNNLVESAEFEIQNLKENLYNIILCGNSTMQHLFFGLRPDSLGISPFKSITKDYVNCCGRDTGLKCPDRCKVVFLPLLGGFVGADTTAALLTIDDDMKDRLIIDLGTNGEIAAGNINNYYVASTACGPALEGGSMDCGMRGAEGAIEKIKIENDDVVLEVIGGREPSGICGSGIIDVTAEMLKNNIIDSSGRMLTKDEYELIKPHSKLGGRIKEIKGINSFILYERKDRIVYISQKDIRQIQLAKSSIYSGCMALLNACGKSIDSVDEIIVAGAFGNYIDVENAIFIGLLPDAFPKIKAVGNGAGNGTAMFLLDRNMKEKCDKITENSTHYELADDECFASGYIFNMNFTDLK